ncbi:hypothetical protein [uncultured Draconibacterium sp.]|uniref:hypothetical protein n=1 Tax=uncultured Draconibacterium sp. TaxID=1573823 RepID=UPI0029C8312A|nr:hypothetical protein [uncultured Draconibacterium sp.]
MKKLRAILVIGLLCFLLPVKNSSAQAEVVKNGDSYVFVYNEIGSDDDTTRWETSNYASKSTISASGNIVKTLYYQLQDDHPFMGYSFIFGASFNVGDAKLVDEMVFLKKDGSFKVTIHSNGAGTRLPFGWQ